MCWHSLVAANLITIDNGNNNGACAYSADVGHSLNDPLQTITTQNILAPVTVAGELYQIVDIGMRMLKRRKLFTARGFGSERAIDSIYNGKPLTKTHRFDLWATRCRRHAPLRLLRRTSYLNHHK